MARYRISHALWNQLDIFKYMEIGPGRYIRKLLAMIPFVGEVELWRIFLFLFFYTPCICVCVCVCVCVGRSVMSDSLWPHGLYIARQAPLCMEFSRQEYWSELPFPSRGDLPKLGTEPRSPALKEDSTVCATREAPYFYSRHYVFHIFIPGGREKSFNFVLRFLSLGHSFYTMYSDSYVGARESAGGPGRRRRGCRTWESSSGFLRRVKLSLWLPHWVGSQSHSQEQAAASATGLSSRWFVLLSPRLSPQLL